VLSSPPRHAHIAGFDLHANVAVPAADRARLEQLAALTPRPRINLILYHGVLAPHARRRAQVVTYGSLRETAAAAPNVGGEFG
jgi:hypothetical protein